MTQKTHGSGTKYGIALPAMALCLLTVSISQAASLYWNPTTGGNGNWDTVSTNLMWKSTWVSPPDTAWVNANYDNAIFRGGATGAIAVDAGGIQVGNITVGASGDTVANNYSFSGGTITLTTSSTITVTNAADIATISSAISGTSFTKLGLGTLVLSGNNSGLSGTVTIGTLNAINGGALRVTNSNALGSAAVTITGGFNGGAAGPSTVNPAQLQLSGGITLTNVITIQQKRDGTGSGPGGHGNPPISSFPASIVNVDGSNVIGTSGSTAIIISGNGNHCIFQSDGGNLEIKGDLINTWNTDERNLVLIGTSTGEISGSIGTSSYTNAISVWKEGSGTWILSGNNLGNAGATSLGKIAAFWVHYGVLRVKNSNALGSSTSTGGVLVASSLYNEVTATYTPATGRLELAGSITIPKSITLQGRPDATNAQLANYSDSNTISGNILLTQVDTNSANGNGSVYLIQSNTGSLTLGGIQNNSTVTGTRQVNLQGSGLVTGVIGGSGTASSPNDISITKSGTGTWTLSGTNTYTGATTINGGTLSLGTTGVISSSSPTISVNGGAYFDVSGLSAAFTLGSGSTVQTLQGAGTVQGAIVNGAKGIISPGGDNTIGTLTTGSLTLGGSLTSTVKFDLA
ncbi:MAG: autotransporter-associated beta strand repeat-containing protein, partial [Thermoguttaceae bacterium]